MTSEDSRNPLPWREQARRIARVRRWSGALAALLLCLAALTLVDGLVALMRAGSTRIELIAGQSESLSGPVSSKNPVPEDLRLRLTPETAPVEFRLEGFFPSYWFGNGMWRGVVSTPPGATPGRYGLTVLRVTTSSSGLMPPPSRRGRCLLSAPEPGCPLCIWLRRWRWPALRPAF